MRIRTDDEVYRVDAVWLGPPKATMPWRARYVAWGVGVVVFLLVLTVERRIGVSLFWAIAWGLVITILITRIITSKISHERPLGSVTAMWVHELTAPREETAGRGGAVSATRVRVNQTRPVRRPKERKRSGSARRTTTGRTTRRRTKGTTRGRAGRTTGRTTRRREVAGVRTPKQARA